MATLAHRRVSLATRILSAKARAGKFYSRVHAMQARLAKIAKPGDKITLEDGRTLVVSYQTKAVANFELKDDKPAR